MSSKREKIIKNMKKLLFLIIFSITLMIQLTSSNPIDNNGFTENKGNYYKNRIALIQILDDLEEKSSAKKI
jgi:hypothetical protein